MATSTLKLEPIVNRVNWTPVNATIVTNNANRNFYVVTDHLVVIYVYIQLSNALAFKGEVDIISNVASTIGRPLVANQFVSVVAPAYLNNNESQLYRLVFNGTALRARNDMMSGSLSTERTLNGQIVLALA